MIKRIKRDGLIAIYNSVIVNINIRRMTKGKER